MISKLAINPIISLILFFLIIVLFGLETYSIVSEPNAASKFSFQLVKFNFPNASILKSLILLATFIGSFLVFRHINTTHKFVEFTTIPSLLFILAGILTFPLHTIQINIALALLTSLLATNILLKIYNQTSILWLVFLSSILISISTILFYPSILLILVIVSSIAILRPFNLKNYIILVIAFSLPILYLLAFNYIFELGIELENNISSGLTILNSNLSIYDFPFLAFVFLAILTSPKILVSQSKFIVRQRNQLVILHILLVLYLFIALFTDISSLLFFILLPTSLYFSYFYKYFNRKWILDSYLILLIICSYFV